MKYYREDAKMLGFQLPLDLEVMQGAQPSYVIRGYQDPHDDLDKKLAQLAVEYDVPAIADKVHKMMQSYKPYDEQITTVTSRDEPHLITLEKASEVSGIPYPTLKSWVRSEYLPERGRQWFHAPGGGRVLVYEADVMLLKSLRSSKGRLPNLKYLKESHQGSSSLIQQLKKIRRCQ